MGKKLKASFYRVKLLILDVDGVLTSGHIIYDDKGGELKAFNVKDGLGVALLNRLGIKTLILSARNSPILKKRAGDMRIAEVIAGKLPKEAALEGIEKKYQVARSEICFIGDDLIDLNLVKMVGLGVAVADAHSALKKNADYITKNKGGQGAVREVVDLIIKAKKLDKKLINLLNDFK